MLVQAIELERTLTRQEFDLSMRKEKEAVTRKAGGSHVSFMSPGGSRFDRSSSSSMHSKMVPDRDIHRCMDGLEESMKLILAALKIPQVDVVPPPNVQLEARAASSSAENLDKDNIVTEPGSNNGGEKMKKGLKIGDIVYSGKVCCNGLRRIIIVMFKLWCFCARCL